MSYDKYQVSVFVDGGWSGSQDQPSALPKEPTLQLAICKAIINYLDRGKDNEGN